MLINKVKFNKVWACGVSEREFISTFHHIHWQELTPKERDAKLSLAWKLLNDKVKGEQPVNNEEGAE
jgi:hypothetical protein